MTENLAARGEGLAGLVAALQAARKFIRGKHSTIPFGPQALLDQIDAALEAAAPAGTAPLRFAHDNESLEEFVRCLAHATIYHGHDTGNVIGEYWREEAIEWVKEFGAAALATPSPQRELTSYEQDQRRQSGISYGQPAATQEQPEPTAEHNRLAASLCGCGMPYMSDCERCERIAAALAKVPRSGEQSSGLGRSKGEPFNLSQNAESAPSSVATQEQPAGSEATSLQATKDETRGDVCEGNAPRLLAESPSIFALTVGNVTGVLFNAGVGLTAPVAAKVTAELNAIVGSPRKVGEDGARVTVEEREARNERITEGLDECLASLKRMNASLKEALEVGIEQIEEMRTGVTGCTALHVMREALRPVPVGEQKQEEGV